MLDRLKPKAGSRRSPKRVGRGTGSGHGRSAGRGDKGAGARAGRKHRPWLEGGQNPLSRRLPKVGFRNRFRDPPAIINVEKLSMFEKGAVLDVGALAAAGVVPRRARRVKLLGRGEVQVPLTVRVQAVSATARRKLEAAGGVVEIVEPRLRDREAAGS